MDRNTKTKAPGKDVLDYLGSYGSAGDGLDPLALDGVDLSPATRTDDKKGQ